MTQTSTEIVEGFFADVNAGEFESAFGRMAADAEFWIAGREWSVGGTYDRDGVMAVTTGKIAPALAGPLKITIIGITAQGERVAVETETTAPTTSGVPYNNQYHFLFVVRDGAIVQVKEYQDTLHASRVIGP
ncbi:nuclear transport factor 2 family protein [Pseudonocardia halophobica]|uniref:nuclear transport factor 2 family protein n=1 Tax=Pseudonocardia halophobica TaxID=29401 RepID=UPI003D933CDA